LHHIGLIAGTALVAGTTGSVLLGLAGIGLIAGTALVAGTTGSVLLGLAGLAVFAVIFSVSAFVIGPAINSDNAPNPSNDPPSPSPSAGHDGLHE